MTESIRERLYENSSILLNPPEKTKYLKQWLKEIKQQIFIDILAVPILISLLIIIFQIKKMISNEIFCENWQNPVKQRITPHFLTTSPSNYYEFTTKE